MLRQRPNIGVWTGSDQHSCHAISMTNMRSRISLMLFALLFGFSGASAQEPSMPDHPALQEAYLAWDRGDYPDALRGYLDVLKGAEGVAHLEEIARLTGEVFKVTEVAPDGAGVTVSPDGRFGTYRIAGPDGPVTKLVDLATGEVVREVVGGSTVLGPNGTSATIRVEDTPAVLAARQAETTAQGRAGRMRAQTATAWEEAKAGTVVLTTNSGDRSIDLGGRAPVQMTFAAESGDLFVVASPADDARSTSVFWVTSSRVTQIDFGVGIRSLLVSADGSALVGVLENAVAGLSRGGDPVMLPGASNASLSANGVLAFTRQNGTNTTVHVIDLGADESAPRSVYETAKRIQNPQVSPDGAHVAFELMDLHDWEIWVAASDGSGDRRLSMEIQHDRRLRWVDAEHIMAAKGEGRHMRSYLYDLSGSEPLKLFHNNSVRTIAPEYEWAVAPGSGKILMIAERDGDTVSPERGVYLLDLNTRVEQADVEARLETALANEVDLRLRGEATFAPIAADVTRVTQQISTGRIFQYARDVYGFGSKHVTQPGNALAIEYYAEKLRSFGYEPELEWFEGRGQRTANVIVRIPGTVDPDLVYVASSHFDSTVRGPGADDDSSGATALLEVARVLKDHPMPSTIELAFFTGEEAGLLGSREYVRRAVASGKRIVGALNNDMVGWKNDHRLDNTIRYSNPGIRDIQHAAAMQFSDLITYDALYYKSTDAAAYYEAYGDIVGGIGSYPVLGNPHYHQWTDRLETISQQLVAEVSKTTAATLMLLASSPARLTGMVVDGESVTWDASPESDIAHYVVEWQTEDGWAATTVTSNSATTAGAVGEIRARAVSQRGTAGWDWARADMN